jgi:hypothetical protein
MSPISLCIETAARPTATPPSLTVRDTVEYRFGELGIRTNGSAATPGGSRNT